MNVLDAKIINTQYGLETYLDMVKNIEVKELHSPSDNEPFYEIVLGIEYFLLRDGKYYDSERNYFRIQMSEDFNSITLRETIPKVYLLSKPNTRETQLSYWLENGL
ncbi:hypothetical protein [Oceanobacillus kimchii]|uniref:hypothetical protein n=1 Tax=Oceanobacillus kimchii TaxID=746691 RepID=UPI003C753ED0